MAPKIRRATITFEHDIARAAQGNPIHTGYKSILSLIDSLQQNLQERGYDPCYERLIFSAEGYKQYLEIRRNDVFWAGVFPRVSGTRHDKGHMERFKQLLPLDTLVVIDTLKEFDVWDKGLKANGYSIKVMDLVKDYH